MDKEVVRHAAAKAQVTAARIKAQQVITERFLVRGQSRRISTGDDASFMGRPRRFVPRRFIPGLMLCIAA
jgi:hypothetical protein